MESGHTPSRDHPEWWDGDVPWIGIADARDHHERSILKTIQCTNAEGLANSAARLLPSGTVCVSRTASVGYVVVMGRPMATSQDFVNWVPTAAVTSDWLRVVFTADRDALIRFGKGSVHKTIYFPEWLSASIALPPLAEQARIVAEVDRQLSIIREVEAEVEKNLRRSDAIRQATLTTAFGQSTTEDSPEADQQQIIVMNRKKLPTLPPARKSQIENGRKDLLAVLQRHPNGLDAERLFQEAGYRGDQVDQFYRDLSAISRKVDTAMGGDDVSKWPFGNAVRINLK
jgi:type I restriction enzyme, S subunit